MCIYIYIYIYVAACSRGLAPALLHLAEEHQGGPLLAIGSLC